MSRIFTLERGDPGAGEAANVTIVGNGHGYDPALQGSLKITVSDGGYSITFSNEGPNTNSFMYGPYDTDEGGISRLLNEDFEGTWPPAGWTMNSIEWSTSSSNSPTHSALINANGDYLITPLLAAPDTMTFWYRGTSGSLNVEYSSSTGGPWSHVTGSPFAGSGSWEQHSVNLSAHSNIYIRFTRVPSAGLHYIDDVVVTSRGTSSGGPAERINYQPAAVPTPSGWKADFGLSYGPRGGSDYYGW
ncbi:MAG: hypothetical protein PHN82_04165 [bacterium]|nr:hypothetical protein [bacterium]